MGFKCQKLGLRMPQNSVILKAKILHVSSKFFLRFKCQFMHIKCQCKNNKCHNLFMKLTPGGAGDNFWKKHLGVPLTAYFTWHFCDRHLLLDDVYLIWNIKK